MSSGNFKSLSGHVSILKSLTGYNPHVDYNVVIILLEGEVDLYGRKLSDGKQNERVLASMLQRFAKGRVPWIVHQMEPVRKFILAAGCMETRNQY